MMKILPVTLFILMGLFLNSTSEARKSARLELERVRTDDSNCRPIIILEGNYKLANSSSACPQSINVTSIYLNDAKDDVKNIYFSHGSGGSVYDCKDSICNSGVIYGMNNGFIKKFVMRDVDKFLVTFSMIDLACRYELE